MRQILKQMWRFLRIATRGPGSVFSLCLLVLVILFQLGGIAVNIRLIQWSADFYNALQKLDMPAAVTQIGTFAALIGTSAGLFLTRQYMRKVLHIRWRWRLTDALLNRWTSNKAYWFMHPSLGGKGAVDNPDQRISEDCNIFIGSILGVSEDSRSGILDFIISLVALVSYVTVLWQLSTFALAFDLFGFPVEIPRYMVWIAPVYVAIATGITHLLGHPLSGLLREEQKREADFRFALMHVRENAAAIALSNGEDVERSILAGRFREISDIWHRVIRREFIYGLFQRPYFQTVLRIPMFLALPAFLAGKVTLGGLMQVAAAFQNVVTTMSWFVFNYKFLSDLVATTRRLQNFLDVIEEAPTQNGNLRLTPSDEGALRISNLRIHTPDGREILKVHNLTVAPGQAVWLKGASGLGKSTLLKTLAGLWPHSEGDIAMPRGRLCFLPQQVYIPLLSLSPAALYPAAYDDFPPSLPDHLLRAVGLSHRLDSQADINGLSVGEQQRLALARVLSARPDWIFLDEATSAIDVEAEYRLMSMLRTELPDATFVIIAHREPQGFSDLHSVSLQPEGMEGVQMIRQAFAHSAYH